MQRYGVVIVLSEYAIAGHFLRVAMEAVAEAKFHMKFVV